MAIPSMGSGIGKIVAAADHLIDTLLDRLPSLILGVVAFALLYVLSLWAARGIQKLVSSQRQNLGVVFGRLTSGILILLSFLVAFSIVAPSFQASDLIKILGIGGVAIGFAFQNILQNFLAGLLLLWTEPFRVGDEIKLDAHEGRVEEIQTRATIIRTYDDRRVVIPNAELFTRSVIVNTAFGVRRWEYDLTLPRDGDIEGTKAAIKKAAAAAPGVLDDPAPEALLVELPAPETVKIRVLWATHDPSQHQMLGSYDRVLSAIADALHSRSAQPADSDSEGLDSESRDSERRDPNRRDPATRAA
jgi:small-conductance mechanosensitive channel